MLREEQVAELLKRCESITGLRLKQIRGNLRKAESRASAIWELLVLEEVSKIGKVEYEPRQGSSPDILLHFSQGRKIWIEIAFLYPRFWKLERQSEAVADWITEESQNKSISPFKVSCRFDGDIKKAAGPIRNLPHLHEKMKFLHDLEVQNFFETIKKQPEKGFSIEHGTYSIELTYSPEKKGPYLSIGGLLQESPKTIKEHAVYRVLKEKVQQHQVKGPRLVCIGSDQSPALFSFVGAGRPTVRDAVYAIFNKTQSLTGVIIIKIEDSINVSSRFRKHANLNLYVNQNANEPLFENEINQLCKLNFNRWNYFFRIEKYEKGNNDAFKRVGGSLNIKFGGDRVLLEIPCNILVDSLAGKTNVFKAYEMEENDLKLKCLNEGWIVTSCSWKDGNIEAGEAPKVVLVLEPPPETVFWSNQDKPVS